MWVYIATVSKQDTAAALAGVSPGHDLLMTPAEGPPLEVFQDWARTLMKPSRMPVASDSLDDAESAAIVAMLWHTGIISRGGVAS